MVQYLHHMLPTNQYIHTLRSKPWSQSKEVTKRKKYFRQENDMDQGSDLPKVGRVC